MADGKLFIHGAGWDTVGVPSLPAVRPTLSVALRFRIPWSDTNPKHTVDLDIVDEDGHSILPPAQGHLRGTVTIGRPAGLPEGTDQTTCLAIDILGLRFERAGAYEVVCRAGDDDAARSPFRVVQMTDVPGTARA